MAFFRYFTRVGKLMFQVPTTQDNDAFSTYLMPFWGSSSWTQHMLTFLWGVVKVLLKLFWLCNCNSCLQLFRESVVFMLLAGISWISLSSVLFFPFFSHQQCSKVPTALVHNFTCFFPDMGDKQLEPGLCHQYKERICSCPCFQQDRKSI